MTTTRAATSPTPPSARRPAVPRRENLPTPEHPRIQRRDQTRTLSHRKRTRNHATYPHLRQPHRITETYATTITHQAQADLTRVATDLTQITPPPKYQAAHQHLQSLTTHAARQLASLTNHWNQTTRTPELHTLNTEATTTKHLSQALLG